jgi:hypothetical protein
LSDTDSDLKPTEKNLPVAIDVVDGNLIVKRHSGKKESFPMGGGFLAGPTLDWGLQALGAGPGGGNIMRTQGATLFAPDGVTDLQDVTNEDLGEFTSSTSIAVGDDFVLSRNGSFDGLWFRNPGLYFMQINAPGGLLPDGQGSVYFSFSGSNIHAAISVIEVPPVPEEGQISVQSVSPLMIPVWPADTVQNNEGDVPVPWQPGDNPTGSYMEVIIWLSGNTSGPRDVYCGAQVSKVG